MKTLLNLLVITLTLNLSAQNEDYVGTYGWYVLTVKDEIIDYKINLESDGTFIFTSYVTDIGKNEYSGLSKGSWIVKNKVIHFISEPTDVDGIKNLNFTGTTARIIKKSPRNKSELKSPTFLQFYKSDIFWVSNLKLTLIE
jgi:hypothetical protein